MIGTQFKIPCEYFEESKANKMRLLETAHIKEIATAVKAHFELFLYEFWFVLKKSGPTSPTLQPLEPPGRLFSPNHMVSSATNSWENRGGPADQTGTSKYRGGIFGQLTFSNGTDGDFYHS